ncbi:MAG TPA: PDZ domain-containing protein [Candidatus Saccharimonadales bacterium]|nr:PDZ domain-containing protein [Candidatus Saccharimonadales bacterium]
MNSKKVVMILGSSALLVTLAALPGSSAHTSQAASPQTVQKSRRIIVSDEEPAVSQTPDNFAWVQEDGDENVQVFVGGGSGWLGVGVSEVTAAKVKELKLPAERGVVLGKVVPESPAAKAGLKENDAVTEINGQRVEGTEQFRRMIREIPSGRSAQLTVWRDGHSQTINVTVGKSEARHTQTAIAPGTLAFSMPDMPQLNGLMDLAPWAPSRTRLGIDAEDLQGDFGKYFGAPEGEGVLVRGIFDDTPAAKAGLKVGDVITTIDGERVRSIGELREKLVEKKSQKSIQLGLLRNKAPLTLSIELPKPAEPQERHSSVRTNI